MRNEVIERTVNDTLVTILDHLIQLIEQAKKQKDIDRDLLIQQNVKKLDQDYPELSEEEKREIEYRLYYHFAQEDKPELFQITGQHIERFPYEQNRHYFDIYQEGEQTWGVVTQEGLKPHRVSEAFSSREALLYYLFLTVHFERFRGETFLIQEKGSFSLSENKHFRLPLLTGQARESFHFHDSTEKLRALKLKEELANNPQIKWRALRQTLEAESMPTDLMGKTVKLAQFEQKQDHVELTIEDNGNTRLIELPDLSLQWAQLKNKTPIEFNELVLNSSSVAEGFLLFYGIELNRALETQNQDFEVISNPKGSFIGKVKNDGSLKKISPYFTQEEAHLQLGNLKHELKKEVTINQDKRIDHEIPFDLVGKS